jgi:protocatechuate 3,4-dioxygenase beta subunit
MDRIPRTVQSPEGPRYEGRLLVRPDDEVVDQGAGFDVATILSRRGALAVLGAGLVTAGLAACASPAPAATPTGATSTGEIPDETAGPYPGDGSNGPDVLEESGVVRSDIRSSIGGGATATGVPMTLELTILDMQNGDAPFAGVAVYVWHCDAQGGYSMYSSGIEGETYLRGVQVADAEGRVTFTSIFPACYSGRWPHIHFEVYPDLDSISDSGNAIATSQVALTESVCRTVYALSGYEGSSQNLSQVTLTSDNVFGDDGGTSQLATITGDATKGYRVALTARVDTATAPTGGSVPSGGMPGGGPGGSGGSGGQGGTPPGRP